MIFLPNKYERFTAALRHYIHRKYYEGEISPLKIEILRKISKIEIFIQEYFPEPIYINNFCFEQFKAARTLKLKNNRKFKFLLKNNETYLIPQKPFEVLICEIIKDSDFIKISIFAGKLVLIYHGKSENIEYLISKLHANYFYEHKSQTNYILFPFDKTDKKSVYIKREWEVLCDPFSLINIYLS